MLNDTVLKGVTVNPLALVVQELHEAGDKEEALKQLSTRNWLCCLLSPRRK